MFPRLIWVPVGLFLVWCVVSQQWYVCHIQKACGASSQADQTAEPLVVTDPVDTLPVNESASGQIAGVAESTDEAPTIQAVEKNAEAALLFPLGSTQPELDPQADQYLGQLVAQLAQSGESLTITGHTDSSGTPQANLAIGLRRAASVRDLLVRKGLARERIQILSEGQAQPKASNDTEEGRQLNRRVELVVVRK